MNKSPQDETLLGLLNRHAFGIGAHGTKRPVLHFRSVFVHRRSASDAISIDLESDDEYVFLSKAWLGSSAAEPMGLRSGQSGSQSVRHCRRKTGSDPLYPVECLSLLVHRGVLQP